jgi:quinone-modifying oxidoreductase subunit QmoA
MAFPMRYVMDPAMSTDDRDKVKEACKYDAIDFDMTEKTIDLKVGAVVWNTGWSPMMPQKLTIWDLAATRISSPT